jgi:outer membrane protein assembly factor BamB
VLGESQIVVMAEAQAMGFAPVDGRTLWIYGRSGSTNGDANCSQVTVVSDDKLLMSKGYTKGGELVQLSRTDDGFRVDTIWKNKRVLKTKFTNPVIHDGFAYSLSDGFLECTDVLKGQQKWKKRGRFGHGQLLLVGNDLLVQSEHGRLYLVAASPDGYQQLGEIKTIDGICWNTLCLAGDYLLVRSESEMACYQLAFESRSDDLKSKSTPPGSHSPTGKSGSTTEPGRQENGERD